MKYLFELSSDRKLVFSEAQLEAFVAAIEPTDTLGSKHVGNNKGTHGYGNSYVHAIAPTNPMEWVRVTPVTDDYVDALKLAAKLEKEE